MKKILSTGLIIAISFMVGCGVNNTTEAGGGNPLKYNHNGSDFYDADILVDKETGVEYIYIIEKEYGGGLGVGSTITPRLNSDGTLRVSK